MLLLGVGAIFFVLWHHKAECISTFAVMWTCIKTLPLVDVLVFRGILGKNTAAPLDHSKNMQCPHQPRCTMAVQCMARVCRVFLSPS